MKIAFVGVVGSLFAAVGKFLADAGTNGELPSWVQWGVLGIVIAGFVTKQLVPGWLYSDIRTENREIKEENKRLVQLVIDTQHEAIPALGAAGKAVEEAMTEIRVLRRRRDDRGPAQP